MKPDLREIFRRFVTEGTYLSGQSFGPGHIHDTYRIITAEKGCDDYILQRINNNVFRDVPKLQENMERVTCHLQKKIAAIPGSDVRRECLTLMPSKASGRSWITDEKNNYWRMFIFISSSRLSISSISLVAEATLPAGSSAMTPWKVSSLFTIL